MNVFVDSINEDDYILVDYFVKTTNGLEKPIEEFAISNSIGKYYHSENRTKLKDHCSVIQYTREIQTKTEGVIRVGIPYVNWNTYDSINQLLQLLIPHNQIDDILEIRLIDFTISKQLKKPKHGISGLRKLRKHNQPFLGAVIHPQLGEPADYALKTVRQLVKGGIDFIHDSSLLGNMKYFDRTTRINKITEYCHKHNVMYCPSLNLDGNDLFDSIQKLSQIYYKDSQKNLVQCRSGIKYNLCNGVGTLRSIRTSADIFIYVDNVQNVFHQQFMDMSCWYKLLCLLGVDAINIGSFIQKNADICTTRNVIPYVEDNSLVNKDSIIDISDRAYRSSNPISKNVATARKEIDSL